MLVLYCVAIKFEFIWVILAKSVYIVFFDWEKFFFELELDF